MGTHVLSERGGPRTANPGVAPATQAGHQGLPGLPAALHIVCVCVCPVSLVSPWLWLCLCALLRRPPCSRHLHRLRQLWALPCRCPSLVGTRAHVPANQAVALSSPCRVVCRAGRDQVQGQLGSGS